MTAKIILNPYANRWQALKRKDELEEILTQKQFDYQLVVSEHPGHSIELAANAFEQGFNPIIAAGGDSTYNEVANGIIQAAPESEDPAPVIFGILPMGTANDLANNLGIPLDLEKAVDLIAHGLPKALDVCKVNDRYFVNNSAIGLETTVTVIQEKMTRVSGVFRYLLATLVAIARNPGWTMQLEWDDGSYQGPVKMVSVGNNPLTGGIFYTVPHANPFDGKLSFVYGTIRSRYEILRTLPKLMKKAEGNYIEHPKVHEFHTTHLRIHTEPDTPAHTDGEIFSYAINDLEYSILPHKIPILLPASSEE